MKIYTGYWAKLDFYKSKNLIPVRISGLMKWMEDEYKAIACIEEVRPTLAMVKKYKSDGDFKSYTEEYNKILARTNQKDVLKQLITISHKNEGKDVIMLCYEKPGEFCHRHIVAGWLNLVLNEQSQIKEYEVD